MHHTVAWRLSTTTATDTDITPVQDTLMLIQNGHFVPQQDLFLLYAYLGAASIDRGRFITPSFRQMSPPWIRPINGAIVPVDEPNVADYRSNPLRIRALEELQLNAQQSSGGAAVIMATAGLSRGQLQSVPSGDIYTMRGTGTTTVTAGSWTSVPITWADTLMSGTYACVGLSAIGATCVAARLIFENQWDRPGCLGNAAAVNSGAAMFLKGGLGVWGNFDANRMPNMEFCCNAADTAQEVYLDFIRIR